jgi:nucleotide-binding universal stress UspA family protein
MLSVSSIVVDVDALAAAHPALEQAVSLAARGGARLKIVDVLPWVPAGARRFVTDDLEKELVEHRRGRLKALAEGVQGAAVTTELLRGRPGTALIQEVQRSSPDLLIRSHGRDLAAGPRPFGATDMELLRRCPCPVWLIGPSAPRIPWRILAAVHANPGDETEQALNATILEWALTLKELGGAQLSVLQAWTAFGASVLRSRMSSEEFGTYVEKARQAEEEALEQFLVPFRDRLRDASVALAPGEPQDAIGRFVESHGIDIVVLGTVARSGITGILMGNTAERVLQRLRASVLAVKPPGFVAHSDSRL